MDTATRLLAGYASLRTSDSDLPEKGSSQMTDDGIKAPVLYRRPNSWLGAPTLLVIHGLILIANLTVAISYNVWSTSVCSHGPQNQNSAARDVIHYEGKKFQLSSVYAPDGSPSPHKPNNFLGPPRAELEEEWEGLIGDINIRLPKSDMDQFSHNANLVNLADGSGYWNTMAVYHGLHCIKRLHHYIHKEYYYEGLNGSEAFRLLEHTEHCLDWLRQYVQCNADTTLIPLYWTPDRLPVALDNGKHQCVKWEPLSNWMKERSFDPRQPGLVVHPTLGEVFANGQGGDKIGIATETDGSPHGDHD